MTHGKSPLPTQVEQIVQWEVWWRRNERDRWMQAEIEHSEHNGRQGLLYRRRQHPEREYELRKVTFVTERVDV